MSRVPVKIGEQIHLLIGDEVVPAKVTQILATQFLCRTKRGGTEQFYFFSDKGVTWQPKIQG